MARDEVSVVHRFVVAIGIVVGVLIAAVVGPAGLMGTGPTASVAASGSHVYDSPITSHVGASRPATAANLSLQDIPRRDCARQVCETGS